jgi:hypothetical protein
MLPMKKIFTNLFLLSFLLHFGQEKMITKTGTIVFEASVPAFEEVKATNEKVSCVLNTTTGEIASLALMKGFRFKIALMEEHFNENYVESDQFPKAIMKGKLVGFSINKINETTFTKFEMVGELEMHGKKNPIKTFVLIKKSGKGLDLKSEFEVNASDYAIEIPSVVSKKVSNKVKIKVDCGLM